MADITDISVKVSGVGIVGVGGINISYGINTIPTALLNINPKKNAGLIKDLESARREPVTIDIKTIQGNLKFSGLMDGLSFMQTPGGLQISAVVKSKFQKLLEVYPKSPGLVPSDMSIFNRAKSVKPNGGDHDPQGWIETLFGVVKPSSPENVQMVPYYINILSGLLELQKTVELYSNLVTADDQVLLSLQEMLKDPKYKAGLTLAQDLLKQIDTSSVIEASPIITASNLKLTYYFISSILGSSNTVLDSLLAGFESLGCCAVVGNNKIFAVPSNPFLKFSATAPALQEKSKIPNVAYPADYNMLSFSDNGYTDYGSCYILSTDTMLPDTKTVDKPVNMFGGYTDTKSKGSGILVTQGPRYAALVGYNQIGITKPGTNTVTKREDLTVDKDKENELNKLKQNQESIDRTKKLMAGWAQLRYLEGKYSDRTGNIGMSFNPKWVPGTPGAAYTRYPGISVDFYVTGVQHNVSIDAPNSGQAMTGVSFACGRLGSGTGFDSDFLYAFDKGKAQAVQRAFIADTAP